MKLKTIFSLILLLCFLIACKSDFEESKSIQKEKYDSQINEVIELENDRLENENRPQIARSETGIVVYN